MASLWKCRALLLFLEIEKTVEDVYLAAVFLSHVLATS